MDFSATSGSIVQDASSATPIQMRNQLAEVICYISATSFMLSKRGVGYFSDTANFLAVKQLDPWGVLSWLDQFDFFWVYKSRLYSSKFALATTLVIFTGELYHTKHPTMRHACTDLA
jgi:hypothetical protein